MLSSPEGSPKPLGPPLASPEGSPTTLTPEMAKLTLNHGQSSMAKKGSLWALPALDTPELLKDLKIDMNKVSTKSSYTWTKVKETLEEIHPTIREEHVTAVEEHVTAVEEHVTAAEKEQSKKTAKEKQTVGQVSWGGTKVATPLHQYSDGVPEVSSSMKKLCPRLFRGYSTMSSRKWKASRSSIGNKK